MTTTWKEIKLGEIAEVVTDYVANGSFSSLAQNVHYYDKPDFAVLIRLVDYNNGFKGNFVFIDEHAYKFLAKTKLYGGEIIISNVGANVGTVFKCPKLPYKMSLAPNSIMVKFIGNNDFYFHWLRSYYGQQALQSIVTGSAQPKFNKTNFKELCIPVPPLEAQNKIASILNALDDKIELNNQINSNLEQQAQALFNDMFPNILSAETTIGCYMLPKRGKNLLSKDAVHGNVPVVAGGLNPSTYHNQANTTAPVVTISASGANAGFVSLWNSPVWASDSSFFDSNVTPYVYFWYTVLKKRQSEIFDLQVGSAQPHIYPQQISIMPIEKLNEDTVKSYELRVKTFFETIGNNKRENQRLSEIRDSLLPKLMSGEIDMSKVDISDLI